MGLSTVRQRFGIHLAVLLAYGVGCWLYSVPLTGDEKVYLTTAMEMWQHGDWLHPWLMGQHSYFKPPFQYWTSLAGWSVLGFGTLGAFLPPVLATVATGWFLSRISARFWPDHAARVDTEGVPALAGREVSRAKEPSAALWFAGCAGTLTYGTTAQMEIWIAFFYCAAWWAALRALDRGRPPFLALALAGVLSVVKSPLYSVLWVLGYWLYLASEPETRSCFRRWAFWAAHALGIAVGAAWFACILATDRALFWTQYIQQETLEKAGGNGSTALHMWGDFTTFCLPWLLLLPAGLAVALPRLRRLALGWALIPAVFFTLFPYRTETYLYILVPLLAVAMDLASAPLPQDSGSERWAKFSSRASALVITPTLLAIALIATGAGLISPWLGALIAAAAWLAGVLSWTLRWRALAGGFLGIIFLFRVGCLCVGEQDIAGLRHEVAARPDRPVMVYDESHYIWHEVGLLAVAIGKPVWRATSQEELAPALRSGAVLVLNDSQQEGVIRDLRLQLAPDEAAKLRIADWWRWKRSFQLPTASGLLALGDRSSPEWRERNQRLYKIVFLQNQAPR